MHIDKETKIFLGQRVKNNYKLHHLLKPIKLREERLRQLKEDNLIPPKISALKNIKIKNRFNKNINLRFYFPINFNNFEPLKPSSFPTIFRSKSFFFII